MQQVRYGAASQIRTGDLILTKDALYLLSYSSVSDSFFIILTTPQVVKHEFWKLRSFFKSRAVGALTLREADLSQIIGLMIESVNVFFAVQHIRCCDANTGKQEPYCNRFRIQLSVGYHIGTFTIPKWGDVFEKFCAFRHIGDKI